MSLMYLILVVAWMIAAFFFIQMALEAPDNQFYMVLAGFAVLMVFYNLVRWWSVRQMAKTRRMSDRRPPRPTVRHDDDESPPFQRLEDEAPPR